MDYLLFTFPNCRKCEELKQHLKKRNIGWEEFDLVHKESKLRIREFFSRIKRDEKGAIIIPALVIRDEEKPVDVVNTPQEFEDWLKSGG